MPIAAASMHLAPALPSTRVLWMLAVAIAAIWFASLDARRLIHPDEGRYAEIAREMVVTGDWVTPRLNDLKYFEKPPLQYWVTALAYEAFGVREWAARLWPALAGFLAVVTVGLAGTALGGRPLGAFAGLALAGTVWPTGIAQIVTLDSGLSFFLTAGFAAFVVAQRAGIAATERRAWMALVWIAMAGATLSKGLIGVVLPVGALATYTALTRDFALWRRLSVGIGTAIYAVLTVPWFVAVARANGEFLQFFFVHEHVERFLTTEHQRTGGWYYFIPIFVVGILPWLTLHGWGARRAWREGTPNALGFSWQRLALAWALFVFVFFSASGSKLASYILPMFAPLALVAGWLLVRIESRTLFRLTIPVTAFGIVLVLAVVFGFERYAPQIAGPQIPLAALQEMAAWAKAAAIVASAGSLAALCLFAPGRALPTARFWGVASLAVSTLAALQIAIAGFDAMSPIRSTSAILRAAQKSAPFAADVPFYQLAMYDQTVPFYLGRTTRLAAIRDELALGIDAEPEKQVATLEGWIAEWNTLARGYAMMPPELQTRLAADGVAMRELARDSRRVIVSRP